MVTASQFGIPEFAPAIHLERTYFGDGGPIMMSFSRVPMEEPNDD
jgi:DNA-binding GntR family transcriptional regulator